MFQLLFTSIYFCRSSIFWECLNRYFVILSRWIWYWNQMKLYAVTSVDAANMNGFKSMEGSWLNKMRIKLNVRLTGSIHNCLFSFFPSYRYALLLFFLSAIRNYHRDVNLIAMVIFFFSCHSNLHFSDAFYRLNIFICYTTKQIDIWSVNEMIGQM